MLTHYADLDVPVTRAMQHDALESFISKLSAERRRALRFRNNRPGVNFVYNSYKIHQSELKFSVPLRQEGKRFSAENAEALTTYFLQWSAFERTMKSKPHGYGIWKNLAEPLAAAQIAPLSSVATCPDAGDRTFDHQISRARTA